MTGGAPRVHTKDPLDAEVARLRAEVDQLRAFVSTIDGDMAAMEDMVEHLDERERTTHWAVGAVARSLGGDHERRISTILWPVTNGHGGHCRGDTCWWRRPARRWAAYGSKGQLLDAVRQLGIKGVPRSRQSLVRALWKAGVLVPPCVDRRQGGAEAWRKYAPNADRHRKYAPNADRHPISAV